MLKIKDNVDLKILEKYGFNYRIEDDVIEFYEKRISINEYGSSIYLMVPIYHRVLEIISYENEDYSAWSDLDDTIYDLIVDGLVEKVED